MKFSDLTKCPFCGNDEFYTNDRYLGTSPYNQRFDGTEAYNAEMYSQLDHVSGAKAYCNNCDEYLGNVNTDEIGKQALKQLYEAGVNVSD